MLARQVNTEFLRLLDEYPVVTILGPRQAGKTTLARTSLSHWNYCNLEDPETRQIALDDPKALLTQLGTSAIIDEIQRVPTLLSYVQVIVDENHDNGQFVLTGSHQLSLHEAISQSLAGRTAILHLYPFSISELRDGGFSYNSANDYIYRGFMPRIYDQNQRPTTAYANYFETYVQKDVRQLIQLKELNLFERFMKLLAGRVGQLIDYSSLASDVGVSPKSITSWLSILEASYLVYKVPPYYENFGKRVIKSPKYYFTDTGLLSYLLGIKNPDQVGRDPLLGQLFENLVVIECLKAQANQGLRPGLHFYRDSHHNEVDLLIEQGRQLIAIEIKAAMTYQSTQLKGLKRLQKLTDKVKRSYLIYAGDPFTFSDGIQAHRFDAIPHFREEYPTESNDITPA